MPDLPEPPVLADGVGSNPVKLFDMRDGFAPVRNLLGVGDPDVHEVGGRWTMFLGGFQTSFRNNLFTATLPPGAGIDDLGWRLTTVPGRPRRAASLVPQPPKGSWDAYGLHTPSYVETPPVRRIYDTGRGGRSVTENAVPYAIGVLEWTGERWERRPDPVHRGTPDVPNALEPKVRFFDGHWHMWYAATVVEAGRRTPPSYQVRYVHSDDGLTWSPPAVLFDTDENFYDAAVRAVPVGGYEMLTCRSTNLYARPDFPQQGLWWLRSRVPSGRRADWSERPVPLLDAASGPEWYGNGIFGPTVVIDGGSQYVFFSGVTRERSWLRTALRRARERRRLPLPAPFYFTVGRARFRSGAGDGA